MACTRHKERAGAGGTIATPIQQEARPKVTASRAEIAMTSEARPNSGRTSGNFAAGDTGDHQKSAMQELDRKERGHVSESRLPSMASTVDHDLPNGNIAMW